MACALTQRLLLATLLPLMLVPVLIGMPVRARADEAPHLAEPGTSERAAPPEAISHYEAGREHFRAGRYGEAIIELKAALAIDPDSANLMYNVAYTSELLGQLDDAIDYYAKYLDALPESAKEEREKTQVTLERLRGRRLEQATEPAQSVSLSAPRESSAGRADIWFWVSLSSGAALLAGGAVTGVLALQREDDAGSFVVGKDGSVKQHNALIDQANLFALSSDLLIAGGAALVVGSALLFFLRDPSTEHAPTPVARAALSTDGKSAVLTLRGTF